MLRYLVTLCFLWWDFGPVPLLLTMSIFWRPFFKGMSFQRFFIRHWVACAFLPGQSCALCCESCQCLEPKECDTLLFFFCSPLLSLVLSSPRRPPLAVLLWRMSRCEASAVRLYGVFWLVGNACARMWWVGVLSVLSSLSLSLFLFFLLSSPLVSLSLSPSLVLLALSQ